MKAILEFLARLHGETGWDNGVADFFAELAEKIFG